VACGSVLTREGVSGDIWELWGGDREMGATLIEGNGGGWGWGGGSHRKAAEAVALSHQTSEAGVFQCLGVVEVSPVKEGGEGCAQVWTRECRGEKKGAEWCSALFIGAAAAR
jgi:hypothetical protein